MEGHGTVTKLGTAQIIQGNALNIPLPDASVDLVCTSPPYFGLRSYQDGGQHYDGQIGSEATPTDFLDALIAATREMVRVLKPSGSIFVNLGDKYAGHTGGPRETLDRYDGTAVPQRKQTVTGAPTKSLIGIPWRYAINCIDQLGLILRAEIIWNKPNGLPESVTDRVRRSHEQWFHFVRQPRYFAAIDEIREEHSPITLKVAQYTNKGVGDPSGSDRQHNFGGYSRGGQNPLGKVPGSVWTVPTQPLTVPPELGVDHFAAYPMEWPRRIIQAFTPNGICTTCGEGRQLKTDIDWNRVPHRLELQRNRTHSDADRRRFGELFTQWQDTQHIPSRELAAMFPSATGGLTGCVTNWRNGTNILMPEQRDAIETRYGRMPDELRSLIGEMEMLPTSKFRYEPNGPNLATGRHKASGGGMRSSDFRTITGYTCNCPTPDAPTTPSVVCDPFGGTGTTALVAKALGRTGITIDLSADYCRLAEWRVNDPRELAAALQVPKPEKIDPDRIDLFEGLDI